LNRKLSANNETHCMGVTANRFGPNVRRVDVVIFSRKRSHRAAFMYMCSRWVRCSGITSAASEIGRVTGRHGALVISCWPAAESCFARVRPNSSSRLADHGSLRNSTVACSFRVEFQSKSHPSVSLLWLLTLDVNGAHPTCPYVDRSPLARLNDARRQTWRGRGARCKILNTANKSDTQIIPKGFYGWKLQRL
jgi:hypothetical protein